MIIDRHSPLVLHVIVLDKDKKKHGFRWLDTEHKIGEEVNLVDGKQVTTFFDAAHPFDYDIFVCGIKNPNQNMCKIILDLQTKVGYVGLTVAEFATCMRQYLDYKEFPEGHKYG
jgi:hypothetical protein